MADVHGPGEHQDTRAERILVVVGIVVLAFNLRPAAVSVGPVLAEVTAELGMSSSAAGLLTTLPVLAFATFGMLDNNLGKDLSRMIYGTTCFAILFSFVGTVLGGIWADQSWGRFWGWDPKENGAVLIVLWNAIILHARWGGLVREFGAAQLAIFGNAVTAAVPLEKAVLAATY